MIEDLKIIKEDFEREKKSASEKEEVLIAKKYLNRLSLLFKKMKTLPQEEKVVFGVKANQIKKEMESVIKRKKKIILDKKDFFDPTIPGDSKEIGHLHLLTSTIREAVRIFEKMGFSVADGPELEDEWHNFDALNFPDDHPAREMQDTLFIKQERRESLSSEEKFLMRTHTSPVQVRHMIANDPPFRIIVPGRVFRNETTDASHEVNFYQIEGLMVDKDISVANFKAVIQDFLKNFYQEDVKIRLRPSFFPFTEPSFEVDMSCSTCLGKGCSVCSQTGWLEIIGAGMVHPNVLKNSGVVPTKWQGFAFGMGWDRIVMMRYKIDDIRLFYNGDLRFLKQF
jgi:phenylalanyl-tRNA synthetase alpha chain